MSLPGYQHINIRSAELEELQKILTKDLNLKNPVVINLKALHLDEQRDLIGLIENFFDTQDVSYKFPYPVFLVTEHESSITRMPAVRSTENLPKFFSIKEAKINVKESQLAEKNHLLQQDIYNADGGSARADLEAYGKIHRRIFELESERLAYRGILDRLMKGNRHG
jgi:hypothetical protein